VPLLAPGHRHRSCSSHRRDLEQLLPAADHAEDPDWYPLTIGLNAWNAQSGTGGRQAVYNLVITGSLAHDPAAARGLPPAQRYWQSGLAAGSVKE
jgi:multiple sugar transport system permease protein